MNDELANDAPELAVTKAPLANEPDELAASNALFDCVLTHVSVELLACA